MKRLRLYLSDRLGSILLLGILLLVLPLAWFIRDLVQGVLELFVLGFLMPIAIHARQLPPEWLWVLLVLLAAAHMTRAFSKEVSLSPAKPRSRSQVGPVQDWLDTLALNNEPYQMGRIPLNRLQQVVLSTLAQQEQVSLGVMRARLRAGRLPLDPALQAFLQTGRSRLTPNRPAIEAPELKELILLVGVEVE
jgi:hypothetical protein